MKAILPHALRPLPPLSLPSPSAQLLRLSSRPLATGDSTTPSVASSLGAVVRSASLVGLQKTNAVVKRSRLGRWLSRLLWGTDLEYHRTFHFVNTTSLFARIEVPGRAAYSAAKLAVAKFSEILEMEIRGNAHYPNHQLPSIPEGDESLATPDDVGTKSKPETPGLMSRNDPPTTDPSTDTHPDGSQRSTESHHEINHPKDSYRTIHSLLESKGPQHTEVIVTNCLPGQVATPVLQNVVLSDGQPANDHSDAMWMTGSPMTAQRCAELMVRAAAYRISECWISRHPMLTCCYAAYYTPWLWRYYRRRFLELPAFKEVKAYNEERRGKQKEDVAH